MRRSIGWLCALAATAATMSTAGALEGPAPGAATAQTLKLPDGPGSLRGMANDPSVNLFAGQVSYEVPLELPGARRDFRPQLALVYRGDLGNGPLGVGWSLRTVAIKRSTRLGVPRFDASDELLLVGVGAEGRLVAAGDGTFRVEGRGNEVKIVPEGAGFRVFDADGVQYVLGASASARQASGTNVLAWMVEDAGDVTGQHITYSYLSDRGQLYPSTVTWGPGGVFRTVFELAARPDTTTSYREGFAVVTGQRVAAVRVESFGQTLRRYVLGYDQRFALSRLQAVTMQGRGGVGTLPPLRFGYAATAAAQVAALGNTESWQLNASGVSLVDVDGDGAQDLLRVYAGYHAYKRNVGGSFAAAVAVTGADAASLDSARLMDVEGKARPNLVTVSTDGWHPYRLAGTTWSALGTWTNSAGLPVLGDNVVLADLNGDARVDVVQWTPAGLSIRMGSAAGLGAAMQRPMIGGELLPGANVLWTDVNGDGLADVVQLDPQSLRVYYGVGDGTFMPRVQVAYPTGAASVPSDRLRFADLDRDGLLDFVVVAPSTVSYYPGRPTAALFASTAVSLAGPENAGDDVVVAIGDVNGNGSDDVVWSSPRGMWLLDLAGATSAGMLVSVDNGSGKTLALQYTASAVLARQDAAAGNPWARLLQVSIPVVTRTTMKLSSYDPARITDYSVRDGFWDATEYTFGGFLFGRSIARGGSAARDLTTETIYNAGVGTNRVLRGRPVTVTRKSGTGTVFDVATYRWRAAQPADLPADPLSLLRKPVVVESWVDHYEGGTTPVRTHQSFEIDDQARVVRETDDGRLDQTGDEKVIVRSYGSNAVAWIRDRVCEEQILDAGGALVRDTRTYYGSAGTVEALCSIGAGLVRRIDGWLATGGGRWVTLEADDYDANGNRTSFTKDGVQHLFTYDGPGLRVVQEMVWPTVGNPLAWNAAWDDVQGVVATLTDPAGATTHVAYDSLGRVASLALGSAPPHIYYQYDWQRVRPRTISHVFDGDPATLPTTLPSWTAGNGWRQSVQVYNGNFELVSSSTRLASASWLVGELRTRDARGAVSWRSEPFRFDGSDVPDVAPTGTSGTALAYDAADRVTAQTLPTGAVRRVTYGLFRRTTAATDLAPVLSLLDGHDRVVHTERTVGGAVEATDVRYDVAGNIVSFTSGGVASTFVYDTLGRVVGTTNPDGGTRQLTWDDAGRLIDERNGAGQHASFSYDAVGRLVEEKLDGASHARYHYDVPRAGAPAGYDASRLAWAEDPEGSVDFAYDAAGRVVQTRRTIRGVTASATQSYAPSGLVRSVAYDDGFAYTPAYDAAGRLISIPGLWEGTALDAAGRVVDERFGNGVVGHTDRDALGQSLKIRFTTSAGIALYRVDATRTSFGALATLVDGDGVGLDHGGSFNYDDAARLTHATIGSGPGAYQFDHTYDSLQNMRSRLVAGPTTTSLLAGTYRYGENGAGPRQLTSVAGATTTTFAYDAAGRQATELGTATRVFAYDARDRLLSVATTAGGTTSTMSSSYGYDGERALTQEPDGTITRWFAPGLNEHAGVRDHYVSVGDRIVARVRVNGFVAALSSPDRGASGGALLAGLFVLTLVGGSLGSARGQRQLRAFGLMLLVLFSQLAIAGCGHDEAVGTASSAVATMQRLYFHYGFSAGPALFTDDGGNVVEERRFEPFGADLDAWRPGQGVGSVSFDAEPTNELNKPTDSATRLSYHGARWFAPETARWLTPDPAVKVPAPKLASAPWDLHPYSYVAQSPTAYWDPDGREKRPFWHLFEEGPSITVVEEEPAVLEKTYEQDDGTSGYIALGKGKLDVTLHPLDGKVEVDASGAVFSVMGRGPDASGGPWAKADLLRRDATVSFDWKTKKIEAEVGGSIIELTGGGKVAGVDVGGTIRGGVKFGGKLSLDGVEVNILCFGFSLDWSGGPEPMQIPAPDMPLEDDSVEPHYAKSHEAPIRPR